MNNEPENKPPPIIIDETDGRNATVNIRENDSSELQIHDKLTIIPPW
jgi:hypothetical protein